MDDEIISIRRYGDFAALVDSTPGEVLGIAHALRESRLFVEVVPAECSVLVTWKVPISHATILEVARSGSDLKIAGESRNIEIPIIYDGLDLAECADAISMTVAELIRIHSGVTYTAVFAGFAPGFLYLTGIDPRLQLPRRSSPRTHVPSGSLAMADVYTAVYPLDSPGGWNLLGQTTVTMFDAYREQPSILQPGDSVRFVPVSL